MASPQPGRTVLVVDDDDAVRTSLARALRGHVDRVHTAPDGEAALAVVADVRPQVVVSDVRMPHMDGVELLRFLGERAPDVDVVLVSGHDDLPVIADAMGEGAADFLVKPLDLRQLRGVVDRVYEDRALRRRSVEEEPGALPPHGFVGRDPKMVAVFKLVGQVARTNANVLIRGESGSGKELVARAIHDRSPRREGPFVAVNCTALPNTLLESELFGHVRGAFTGAAATRKGRFELAAGGTILLDEIGDTAGDFQAKLLRVLQEREFFPVGADEPAPMQARVVAATHRDLEERVREGTFREDLYYRLRVVEIELPPLRERKGDLPALARHLVAKACAGAGLPPKVLAPDALEALLAHPWPGNVRELENCLMRAAVVATGPIIRPAQLVLPDALDAPASDEMSLSAVERAHVARVLRITDGHKSRAAEMLEVSRPRLDRLIQRHGLTV